MTIDEAISHAMKVAERQEYLSTQNHGYCEEKWNVEAREQCAERAAEHRQFAEWLTELKDLREENKVLTSECDRLTKEKEELNKLKEKAVLDICRREARLREAKRLLKAAVEDLNVTVAEVYNGGVICECCKWESQIGKCSCPNDGGCDTDYQWRYADEALTLIGDEPNGI